MWYALRTMACMPRLFKARADSGGSLPSPAVGAMPSAVVLAAVFALLMSLTMLWSNTDAAHSWNLTWLLTLGVVVVAIAAAAVLWRQRGLSSHLHDARLELQGLADLFEPWLWRSDARHCVTLMRPPAGSPEPAWTEAETGEPLWEYYGGDAAAAAILRRRLEARASLDGLRVWRRSSLGESELVELRGLARNDTQGRFTGYLGSARVLNEAEALRADQRLLTALLAGLPMPVLVLTGTDGGRISVQRVNAAAADMLRVKPARMAGLPLADLQTRLPAELCTAITRVLHREEGESERVTCDGWKLQAHRVDACLEPSERCETNAHTWVLTLFQATRDEAAPGRAAGSDHESFSYSVSHDLRAPLRVVDGFTKILKEDYGRLLDRIGNDHLDRVLSAAARMNSMIDALLALSQLTARPLTRQPVNLSQLAGYIVDDLRRQSPERGSTVHIETGLQAHGDPTLLRVALENLVGNAWKYTAKKRDAQIWLERTHQSGRPAFTVRDNGAGFDMRFADRLFGVFQRLHSANDFPGTGVGLATVRRIINRHGGEIWAESQVDHGCSFHFTLPSRDGSG